MSAMPRTIDIRRAMLSDPVSMALIAALNVELQQAYSEPGSNHFQLDPDQVA